MLSPPHLGKAMARITIEVSGMRDVERRLERLADAAGDLTPAFRDVGEALLNSTRDRFDRQAGPDGRRWAPLSPEYARRKPRNRDRILTLYGELQGTLRYVATADSVAVGTNEVYGPTHQFGDESRNIPARPFLGLSAADADDVLDIIENHLRR